MKETIELSSLETAEQKIPPAWYESHQLLFRVVPNVTMIYSCLYGIVALQSALSDSYTFFPHLLSTSLYFLSELADRISTFKGIEAENIATKNGVHHNYQELNPWLSHVKTGKDLVYHPKSYLTVFLGLGSSVLFPGLGIPLAAGKTLAALNNFRIVQRLKLATAISQQRLLVA